MCVQKSITFAKCNDCNKVNMKRYGILLTACAMAMTMTAQRVNTANAPLEDVNKVRDVTLDSLNKANTARPVPGSSRKGDNPVLFLCLLYTSPSPRDRSVSRMPSSA